MRSWSTLITLCCAAFALGFRTQIGKMLWLPEEIPAQSCREALDLGLDYTDSIPTPPTTPDILPFPKALEIEPPKKLPRISLIGNTIHPTHFMPAQLGLQPLEGYPEDLVKIGQVMRRADAGERVRITFFGASHTAGDFWTGHIRRVLQARYGDVGHGFIMPVAMAKGSRGSDINLCSNGNWMRDYVGKEDGWNDDYFGLGMTVSSDDPTHFAWLETTHQNPIGRQFSTAHIFTLGSFGGGSLLAQVDRSSPLLLSTQKEEPQLLHTKLVVPDRGHRLTLSPSGDGMVRLLGLSIERDGPGILVDSIGIRGRQAFTWLRWNEFLLRDMLSTLNPDIIVLAYGTNEANDSDYTMERYSEDLRAVLQKMKSVHPNEACILVGPSDRGHEESEKHFSVWERTQLVADVQRNIAPEFGCAFWDWQQATGGVGSMITWNHTSPKLSSPDLIHFTPQGYQVSADLFVQALDDVALHYQRKPNKKRFRWNQK